MSEADVKYGNLIREIIERGVWDRDRTVRSRWQDGSPAYTKGIVSVQLKFDNSEVPILTQKEVKWKTAIKEILWIWQRKSNVVQDLRDMGVNIWNAWELPDGTIGKAYGYQLRKKCRNLNGERVDQVDYLLHQLRHDPASRRLIVSLWDVDDLDEMSLLPCVWQTQWLVKEGRLHLIVGIRSNDMALGHPFNVFQYYVLQRMIAQVTDLEVGTLTFNINDAHVYERHIEPLKRQLELPIYPTPQLWINPRIRDFYDFTIDDFRLLNYQHGPFIRMEVAV